MTKWSSVHGPGLLLAGGLALVGSWLGGLVPVMGGSVLSLLLGLGLGQAWRRQTICQPGLRLASKQVMQYAVVCLGFGLPLGAVLATGRQVLPLLLVTVVATLFVVSYLGKWLGVSRNQRLLIAVGTAICGGSAIAAAAPVLGSEEEDIAQSLTVIVVFNLLAALLFPTIGLWLGLSSQSGEAFGIFAGTAVNDTSSVTATASSWDVLHQLGSQTLDKAVTVKLTRTLAILPVTLFLSFLSKEKEQAAAPTFPSFILYFLLASLLATIGQYLGLTPHILFVTKPLARFLIMVSMAAIGLLTDGKKVLTSAGRPVCLGFLGWGFLLCLTLFLQGLLGIG